MTRPLMTVPLHMPKEFISVQLTCLICDHLYFRLFKIQGVIKSGSRRFPVLI